MKKLLSSLLGLALVMGLCTSALAAGGTFSDVPENRWYTPYIERAASQKWVSGVGGGRFSPNAHVTYGQFCTMICNALYPQDVATQPSGGQWWERYASVADQHNLFSGTNMEQISTWSIYANRDILREEMAIMLSNAIKDTGATMPTQSQLDAAQGRITDFAYLTFRGRSPVLTCYAMGLLSGYNDGRFGPSDSMTRAQAATVLCNVYDALNPSDPEVNQPDVPATTEPPVTATRPADAIGGQYDVSVFTVPADVNKDGYITEAEVQAVLDALQKEFPAGIRWSDPAIWGTDPSSHNGYINADGEHYYNSKMLGAGTGCAAWAKLVSDRIFGDLPRRTLTDAHAMKPGDIEYMPKIPHWAINLGALRYPNYPETTDGNSGKDADISWGGGSMSWDEIQTAVDDGRFVLYTRYPAE